MRTSTQLSRAVIGRYAIIGLLLIALWLLFTFGIDG